MKLSVIIVNHNQKYFPRMCLEALEKSPTNFKFEIIVVDNNSSDESLSFLEKAAQENRIKLIKSPQNLGYGRGNNLGVRNAEGEFILILNPDVFVEKETLRKMVDYLEKYPEIGILGPKLVYHNGQVQESCRHFMTFLDLIIKRTFLKKIPPFKKKWAYYLMRDFDHQKIKAVDLLTGACFLIRKELFEKVGGFDERYFLFMEDFDLCQKVHQKGLKVVYFPETEVTHFHKRLSEGSLLRLLTKKVFWHHLKSSLQYFWKWRKKKSKKALTD